MLKKYKKLYLVSGLLTLFSMFNINLQEVSADEITELKVSNVKGSTKLNWITEFSEENIILMMVRV